MPADGPATIPETEAAGRLTVDLDALTGNWRNLASCAAPAECAAVVKADAYGIGISEAVPALARAGCRTFFVAIPAEARAVRAVSSDATIYVLNGFRPSAADAFLESRARPVLGSLDEIETWSALCRTAGRPLPAATHIDTGMNRLGLSREEVEALAGRDDLLGAFELSLVMSHLACADMPDHPLNPRQAAHFDALRRRLPAAPASLANSGGTLLGDPYRFDLVRPGIALYGGRALGDRPNPMAPVIRLETPIVQIRSVRSGESVGYGAAQTLMRDSRIAVLSAGYADGYIRAAGSTDRWPGGTAFLGDYAAPIVGRVSMDLIAVDITRIPESRIAPGDYMELLGNRFTVDDLADRAGTIGYEVLTRLGRRFHRIYLGAGK